MKTAVKDQAAGRTWAYLRVSTDKQDVENQRLEILKLANERGVAPVQFVEDPAVSGRVTWRERKIAGILEEMQEGDALILAELSRLGRSMYEIMEILALAVKKGVRIYAAKGGWSLDDTIQSKILGMVFAMAAEIERDLNVQRTRAAMATRRAMVRDGQSWVSKAGNVVNSLGRPRGVGPSKLDKSEAQIREALGQGVKFVRIAKDRGTTPANLRHWMRMHRIGTDGKTIAPEGVPDNFDEGVEDPLLAHVSDEPPPAVPAVTVDCQSCVDHRGMINKKPGIKIPRNSGKCIRVGGPCKKGMDARNAVLP
jgi:DNA invertase Pin-like site-specific DNA recombinase